MPKILVLGEQQQFRTLLSESLMNWENIGLAVQPATSSAETGSTFGVEKTDNSVSNFAKLRFEFLLNFNL